MSFFEMQFLAQSFINIMTLILQLYSLNTLSHLNVPEGNFVLKVAVLITVTEEVKMSNDQLQLTTFLMFL